MATKFFALVMADWDTIYHAVADLLISDTPFRRTHTVEQSRPGVGNLFMLEGRINLAVIK
jgi:hypothetical protein